MRPTSRDDRFPQAYRRAPIQGDQKEFASILIAPPVGPIEIAKLRTQPFGSKRAPSNWPRVTNFAKWCLLKVFRIVISVYVDDVFLIEPAGTIQSAFRTIKIVCGLFGFAPAHSKWEIPAYRLTLLGADIDIDSDILTARLPDRKRCEILNELRQILTKWTLTPEPAAKSAAG